MVQKACDQLAESKKFSNKDEVWRVREEGRKNKQQQKNSCVVNYGVVEFVMDARSASLSLIHHPSSQVRGERY